MKQSLSAQDDSLQQISRKPGMLGLAAVQPVASIPAPGPTDTPSSLRPGVAGDEGAFSI